MTWAFRTKDIKLKRDHGVTGASASLKVQNEPSTYRAMAAEESRGASNVQAALSAVSREESQDGAVEQGVVATEGYTGKVLVPESSLPLVAAGSDDGDRNESVTHTGTVLVADTSYEEMSDGDMFVAWSDEGVRTVLEMLNDMATNHVEQEYGELMAQGDGFDEQGISKDTVRLHSQDADPTIRALEKEVNVGMRQQMRVSQFEWVHWFHIGRHFG